MHEPCGGFGDGGVGQVQGRAGETLGDGWTAGRLVSVGMSTCTALRLIHAEFLLSFGIVFLTRVPMG